MTARIYCRLCASFLIQQSRSARRLSDAAGAAKIPKYNYGLPGYGKKGSRSNTQELVKGMLGEDELLFGLHPVSLALQARRRKLYQVFMKKSIVAKQLKEISSLCCEQSIPVEMVTSDILNKLAGNRPHQGVCLYCSPLALAPVYAEDDTIRKEMLKSSGYPAVWLLPYRVKDPMNLGAVLRSAYFLGVDKVMLPRKHSASLSPIVSKSSSGAQEVMDIQILDTYPSMMELLQVWKRCGGRVVGTTCQADDQRCMSVSDYTTDVPTLLIVGNEGEGVRDEILESCDVLLYIQTPGDIPARHPGVDSLNVSVATGVTLHSLMHSRKRLPEKG